MVKTRIRKNDIVQVIAGRDKGKQGRVLNVDRKNGRILVEHVMMAKKHVRPNPARQIKGGIAEREAMLHISNVMIISPQGGPTRIGMQVDKDGHRTRICRRSGLPLERK
jgi:large subunit ribosomal protein L24